jgi:hypothetical protein
MGQNAPSFRIAFGGGLRHATGILMATYHAVNAGWKLENPDWLKIRSICPGIPDVYVSKIEKGVKRFAVIEIESIESPKADAQKYLQFEGTTERHRVYIIHLDKMKNPDSLKEMSELIKLGIP